LRDRRQHGEDADSRPVIDRLGLLMGGDERVPELIEFD
jgi:hypothetical protein